MITSGNIKRFNISEDKSGILYLDVELLVCINKDYLESVSMTVRIPKSDSVNQIKSDAIREAQNILEWFVTHS